MKFFGAAFLSVFLVTTAVHASSKYAGQYYAVLYDTTYSPALVPLAGVNLTVGEDGTLSGQGGYFNLAAFYVTGNVKNSGQIVIVPTTGRLHIGHLQAEYKASFSKNGKKFSTPVADGLMILGKKIPGSFPAAGVYHAATDTGDEGIFIVASTGAVIAVIENEDSYVTEVEGTATAEGFSSTLAEGSSFTGTFDGDEISGTYSDGMGGEGAFSGAKY